MNNIEITICIPVFNEDRYIEECLESIKQQTLSQFLVFIGDNASDDKTGEICQRFASSDARFHYNRHASNLGAAKNVQGLIDRVESKYLITVGAHDKLHPTYLEQAKRVLDRNPAASLVYSKTSWIDESGRVTDVSSPKAFASIAGNPYQRYIRSIRAPGERTAINHLIRRSAYDGVRFEPVLGCDEVVLAKLLFSGNFEMLPDELYFRRQFVKRAVGYAERIIGECSVAPSRRMTMALFIRNYMALPNSVSKFLHLPWLYWESAAHCEQDIFAIMPAVRRFAKRCLPQPIVLKIQSLKMNIRNRRSARA